MEKTLDHYQDDDERLIDLKFTAKMLNSNTRESISVPRVICINNH
jgi:hypothetical protein